MTLDEIANHPIFKENNGAATCVLLKDHLLHLQRNCAQKNKEDLEEIGRRMLVYDEILASLDWLSDPKFTPTSQPKRKRLHNQQRD